MRIVLATGNKGKIKEFKNLLPNDDVIAFSELLGEMEIIEDADTFKGNAIIKAQTIFEKLNDENVIVISDDSGITVPALNNEPGIYSARYAGEDASDKDNLYKLIDELNKKNIKETSAYYTACIAIVHKNETYTVHGWMHGQVINQTRGEKGFGYDPMFIPNGFNETLGELAHETKQAFSHRSQALELAKKVIGVIL